MGFFSSIKKIFSGSDTTPQPLSTEASENAHQPKMPEAATPSERLSPPVETAPPATSSLEADPAAAFVAEQETTSQLSDFPKATPLPESASASTPADDAMILRLREAEPRLSAWLSVALEGIDETGDLLWKRIRFLLIALDAPAEEAEAFVRDVSAWVDNMEYVKLADFRSELQYRLALALDMEDEEDERNRLFVKLNTGLAKTRDQLGRGLSTLFAGHSALTPAFWNELEELFIMADMGVDVATELCNRLKDRVRTADVSNPADVRALLAEELAEIFRAERRVIAVNKPEIVLMIGVNGAGKTTTIAKLAYRERARGKKVLLAAGDTFRAAAVEQLGVWAERTGALFHAKAANADPSAVAWEAVERALEEQVDVLFIDTAGRLQTKINLMDELKKIRATIAKKHPGAPHRTVLVLDATTGQNALSQAKLFNDASAIDEIILTKLDGTAKGGVAVAVAMRHNIPISFVGLGEKMEDLRPFNGDDYAKALLNAEDDRSAS